jgi:putative ABC transport system permease protein
MLAEHLDMARRALLAHRFRSSLTVLSILVGALAIVLMTSLAQSGVTSLLHSLEEFGGARLLLIAAHSPEKATRRGLERIPGVSDEDREVLLARLPHVERSTFFASFWHREAQNEHAETTQTDLVGATADFLSGFGLHLAKGRMFTDEEELHHARVCVVGDKLATKLWKGDDPIGHELLVAGVHCTVIGELSARDFWGFGLGFDWRDNAILPRRTVREKFANAPYLLVLTTDAAAHNDIVKRVANALMTDRHHGLDDFELWDFQRLMKRVDSLFQILEIMVGFIAGIALLVGGVGVMDMMLVSVSERVKEIGIRKALGATPADVGLQFLLEATVLSSTGGLLGVAVGVGLTLLGSAVIAHYQTGWQTVVSMPAAAIALSVSLAVGLVFGFFPARKAARLDPVAAIRGA